jgi:hypothetical protein
VTPYGNRYEPGTVPYFFCNLSDIVRSLRNTRYIIHILNLRKKFLEKKKKKKKKKFIIGKKKKARKKKEKCGVEVRFIIGLLLLFLFFLFLFYYYRLLSSLVCFFINANECSISKFKRKRMFMSLPRNLVYTIH